VKSYHISSTSRTVAHLAETGPDQVAEKLEALLTEAPEWISQFTVDSQQYIRVSNDLKLVVDVKIKLLHLYKDLLR
jgi:hypothetical protein